MDKACGKGGETRLVKPFGLVAQIHALNTPTFVRQSLADRAGSVPKSGMVGKIADEGLPLVGSGQMPAIGAYSLRGRACLKKCRFARLRRCNTLCRKRLNMRVYQ